MHVHSRRRLGALYCIVGLARLSKFFGFLGFSSPRAVKTPLGAQTLFLGTDISTDISADIPVTHHT